MRYALMMLAALTVGGCQTDKYDSLAFGPTLSPVGHGLETQRAPLPVTFSPPVQKTFRSTWNMNGQSIYRDVRATQVGDGLTVIISIDDKAQFDNETDRSRDSSSQFGIDAALTLFGFGRGGNAANGSGDLNVSDNTQSNGKGSIDRSEKLRLAVAVVVTETLPNGYFLISGSQEIRVNYEVRVLSISGIVNPLDVSSHNTIPYDKIAEARISYAGRGRLNDVQQPAWGQRIYDVVAPW